MQIDAIMAMSLLGTVVFAVVSLYRIKNLVKSEEARQKAGLSAVNDEDNMPWIKKYFWKSFIFYYLIHIPPLLIIIVGRDFVENDMPKYLMVPALVLFMISYIYGGNYKVWLESYKCLKCKSPYLVSGLV